MFKAESHTSQFRTALGLIDLIYVSTVRSIRQSHRNAVVGLASNIAQTMLLVGAFYLMFSVLGLRGMAIRGDFVLYLLSGIFLYMTHIKAMTAVVGSEGPTSPMMKHAPMNTAIAIASSALAALYIQFLSVCVILFAVHVLSKPIEMYDPIGAGAMFLLAWFTGVAAGMVFLAIKPFAPGLTGTLTSVYTRLNMIASGKMFVANTMGGHLLQFFDWNPLFHCIDQARGFAFINYNPIFSNISYPIKVAVILITIGLMGEFYARKKASLSWYAGR